MAYIDIDPADYIDEISTSDLRKELAKRETSPGPKSGSSYIYDVYEALKRGNLPEALSAMESYLHPSVAARIYSRADMEFYLKNGRLSNGNNH